MQQRHARRCRSRCSSSTITLVEAGMSGILLGNQAWASYGGNNERLRSDVSLSASLVFLQTAIRHRVSPEFIGPRNCVPMAFTAESPPAQGQ